MSSVHVSYIPYVSYMFFNNVVNNIKRRKKPENQNDITSSHVHASQEYVSSRFYVISNIFSNKYKTHKGHRTHELTTQVSSCVLYPLCVLYFTNSNCKIYLGRIKKIRGWGILVIFFVFMFSSCFMLFPTFLETYETHKEYRTHELMTNVRQRLI